MQETPQHSGRASETARRVEEIDWNATPLGPMPEWPQSLKTSLSICLDCRFPILLWWGAEMVLLYNDDYIPVLGKKHPAAMGGIGRRVWADVWPVIGPMLEGVVTTGRAAKAEDLLLIMNRNGYEEETYFSFSYSPITDESGGVGGIFTPVIETTEKVIGHRRIETLRRLGNQPRASSLADACQCAANVLAEARADIPFGLIYTIDETQEAATLTAAFGMEDFPDMAAPRIRLADPRAAWPLTTAMLPGEIQLVPGLDERFGRLPAGAWSSPVANAILAPITMPGNDRPVAILVAAVSPHRALDDAYLSFYNLLADQLESMFSEALAYEAERKRVAALAEIDRAKTIFFSNVSHEFRTPLALMLGPVEDLLADDSLPPDAHRQIALLQRNGVRLLKLVNALLDFSRIEAGRMQALYEPLDIARYTADLASVFRSAIEKAGMRLDVACAPLARAVYLDRGMWEKIVLNLLSNAFKFTFEGTISVSVSESGGNAVLRVSDTGVGIAAEHLPLVFERFRRIEGARSRTHEGSGIGLALVRDLVALHGGDIRIESAPGRGTALTVVLPFGSSHLPSDQIATEALGEPRASRTEAYVVEAELWLSSDASPGSSQPVDGREDREAPPSSECIFVVDDNADMRDYVMRLLQQRWRVQSFGNAMGALSAARMHRPGLIIADVMMPGMDGFGLLAALREDPATRETAVILLSARAGEEARISGMEAGADEYLVKPFSSRELIARVESLLMRSRVHAIEAAHARNMELVFQKAPAAIAMLRGPEHVYEFVNPLYLDLIGHRKIVGKPIRAALPELEGQGIYELLDEVYRSGNPHVGRSLRIEVMKGAEPEMQEYFFDFVYQPMADEQGRVEGIAVVAFDVSDLSKARQAAEQANRTKDEFLAMLGHELRNPLAPIMTALELMKLRGIEGGEKERAIIERQARHLVGLVDDLLDVARVARGKITLRKRTVEIAIVIAKAIETASPLLDERGHVLHVDVPENVLPVHVDSDRFGQVIANLLTNAAKYTPPAGQVTIRARAAHGMVAVEVIDTGNGIAPEMLPHVFDMFFQGKQGIARSPGGLGLGLTIVRNLTALHGGTVSAHSEGPGKGSTFVVRVPEAMPDTGPARHALEPPDSGIRPGKALSVLVVDDNADAARTLETLLTSIGHHAMLAFDGPSAFQCARLHTPDIAILDLGLPGMDGFELARRIRELPGKESICLVALSGYGQASDRKKTRDAGFDMHVVKPLNLAQLQDVLKAAATCRNA